MKRVSPVLRAILCALAPALLAACDPAARPDPPRGKHALHGDPALVPTRAGERAREELARAGAVEAALRALGAGPLHVEVRLPQAGDPGALVVAGEAPPGLAAAELRALAVDLCGPWSAAVARVHLRTPAAAAPGARAHVLPLALALLGLGASAGVTLERLRQRRRA